MKKQFSFFLNRIINLENRISILKKQNNKLSGLRLFSFIGAFIIFYIILPYSIKTATIFAILFVLILLIAIIKHSKNSKSIAKLERLIAINNNEIAIINGNENKLFDNGEDSINQHHAYVTDLDILGKFSLYQQINRCVTQSGNNCLSKWLLKTSKKRDIEKRQEAVKELTPKIDWRQEIMQYGLSKKLENKNIQQLINWEKEEKIFRNTQFLKIIITVLSMCSFLAIIYAFISSYIPLLLLFFISLGIHAYQFRKVATSHQKIAKKSDILDIYSRIIAIFEQQEWQAELLQEYQQKLGNKNTTTAKKIAQLSKLIALLDQRGNVMIQVIINSLFFFELQLLFAIDKWLNKYGSEIENWFAIIGEIEAISSMANLSFNHPQWCFPKISDNYFELEMESIGHPLIPENRRICNNYSLVSNDAMIHIITGSNMAGKSTFLRTVGINIVLALSGAPVCASKMVTSVTEVNTSMRIKDSIEENESSFYAELRRIKYILEKVNKGKKTLLLLDEILRGTNTKDKHTGSVALIKQLVKSGAVGLVATHDLELSALENELNGKVKNHFFDIKIDGDKLYFDYKLQKGVCNTFNAPILMQKMGIELP